MTVAKRNTLIGIGIFVAVAAALALITSHNAARMPLLDVSVVSYTNYPDRIEVVCCLTNKSPQRVVYPVQAMGSYPPMGWITAETKSGWSRTNLQQLDLRGAFCFFPPHDGYPFTLSLPPDTARWRLGFRFRRLTVSERIGIFHWLRPLSRRAADALEQRELRSPLDLNFESDIFEVAPAAVQTLGRTTAAATAESPPAPKESE